MTAAIQHRTHGPAHRGQSRFFASRVWRRAPRFRNARPEKRVAGQKTAPGIFFATAPKTRPENASQTFGTHQENYCWAYDFASGCAVAPNNTGVVGAASSGSGLGNALRNIPLLGRVLGGAGDIVSGVVGTAAGIVTLGHSGTLGSGLSNIGNGLGGVAMGGLDLVGKAWTLPNTAIGLVAGVAAMPFGAKIGIGNNAIQFTNFPVGPGGALTLGNVQLYTGMKPNDLQSGYDGAGPSVPVGSHEEGHTYQYQVFGPLFLPAYFISGGISGSNPFEKGADNYSRGGSWAPKK